MTPEQRCKLLDEKKMLREKAASLQKQINFLTNKLHEIEEKYRDIRRRYEDIDRTLAFDDERYKRVKIKEEKTGGVKVKLTLQQIYSIAEQLGINL